MLGMTMRVTLPGIILVSVVSLAMLFALSWYLEVQSARKELMLVAESNADCMARNAVLNMQTAVLMLQLQQNLVNMNQSIEALSRDLEPPWVASDENKEGN